MDGHVGDDFPDGYPEDFSDSASDGSDADGDDGDLTGVGDAWEHDTVDLDAEPAADASSGAGAVGDADTGGGDSGDGDAAWLTAADHPIGGDAVDFDAEETGYADDVPDTPDAPDDGDSGDVPIVGDDAPVGLGADPDAPAGDSGDSGWLDLPDLANVDVPEPAGGPPWVDTGLLGDSGPDGELAVVPVTGDSVPATPDGGAADLRAALGEPAGVGDPTDSAYQELVASDDPAVRNLARLWGPPG